MAITAAAGPRLNRWGRLASTWAWIARRPEATGPGSGVTEAYWPRFLGVEHTSGITTITTITTSDIGTTGPRRVQRWRLLRTAYHRQPLRRRQPQLSLIMTTTIITEVAVATNTTRINDVRPTTITAFGARPGRLRRRHRLHQRYDHLHPHSLWLSYHRILWPRPQLPCRRDRSTRPRPCPRRQ